MKGINIYMVLRGINKILFLFNFLKNILKKYNINFFFLNCFNSLNEIINK